MISQNLTVGTRLCGFIVERIEPIPELRCEAALFSHEKTGARLLHLFNDDRNNLFCAGFRTPAYDHTGVPHILEHSVLAGSRKYPIKDPFKEMLKGSMQTFLNAMTYPDKTIYPVASQVEADFYNLVDIYCDAIFHPLLTEHTFRQEGWHFDVENPDNPVSIKGIVYNEMKGVFSDFRSHVARRTMGALFPDTTYAWESGGDPEHIPELTYEAFKDFHARYYHPSNSFTVLYGNLPSEKTLSFLNEHYLSSFTKCDIDSTIATQPSWDAPHELRMSAPGSKEDDGLATVLLTWKFCDATNPVDALTGRVLSHYLFDGESSPLRRALMDSELGEDIDDMTGFDPDLAHCTMAAGLRKCKPENAEKIRDLILDTLRNEIASGMDAELLEGSLRTIEFRLREIIDGGHFPYSIMLAERAYRSWIYGGDPLVHLKFDSPLSILKAEKAKGTAFFVDKMKTLLLDNPHALLAVVTADSALGEKLGKRTEAQAADLSRNFTQDKKQALHESTMELLAEQKRELTAADLVCLPVLKKSDIPRENEKVDCRQSTILSQPLYAYPLFTAGIAYLDLAFDLRTIPENLLPYFPLYEELITRCGAAGNSAAAMAKRVTLSTGGISTGDFTATKWGDGSTVFLGLVRSKALYDRFDEMIAILKDMFLSPKLDDTKLIKEILMEIKNSLSGEVISSGNTFASLYASSHLDNARYIEEILDGLTQLRFVEKLLKRKKDGIADAVSAMKQIHALMINRKAVSIVLTADDPQRFVPSVTALLESIPAVDNPLQTITAKGAPAVGTGVTISASVNYVARCLKLPTVDSALAGRLALMTRNLSAGFLWDKVRVEGGAYGGSAGYAGSYPIFTCSSYRDPNITRTIAMFKAALEHVASGLAADDVERTITGTIGRLDHPRGPHSKAFGETMSLITGRTWADRQVSREAILSVTPEELARDARMLLDIDEEAVAVFGSADAFKKALSEGAGLVVEELI